MTKIKIAVAGCLGRMGQELSKKIIANNKLEFVGGFEHKKHKNINKEFKKVSKIQSSNLIHSNPTPSIKLATNTNLYKKMNEDMDINCGLVIEGKKNIDEMGAEIFEEFISFASGRKTKSEILNLGRHEFAPWQIGITG